METVRIVAWYVGDPMKCKPVKYILTGRSLLAVATTGTKATGAVAFGDVIAVALNISDYLCIGVLIFAGASWMLGNRTKAMEHILGACSGYMIVRNAVNIQHWLRGLCGQ